MIRTLLFLYFFLIINLLALAEKNGGWPYTQFSYAKLYLYNLTNNYRESQNIIIDGKLNASVIGDGFLIENAIAEDFVRLTNKNIAGLVEGLSKTFIPHHAIVFYNSSEVPVANIIFSFDGQIIKAYPVLHSAKVTNELSEKEILRLEKISNEFKQLFINQGFPVFDSPFDYPKFLETIKSEIPTELTLNLQHSFFQFAENQTQTSKMRFDLSGLANSGGKTMAIADKEWNKYIYQVDTFRNCFHITELTLINIPNITDLEAIDCVENKCIVADEATQKIYQINIIDSSTTEIPIPWQKFGYDINTWGNAGLEGLAIRNIGKEIYLIKERDPGKIIKFLAEKDSLSEPFEQLIKPFFGNNDFSDLKIENDNLYILHRQPCIIIRINLLTHEVKRWSYKQTLNPNGQKIHNSRHQTAEALLLLPNEIWIGIDNNETQVTSYGEKLGLQKGTKTAIFVFDRPADF